MKLKNDYQQRINQLKSELSTQPTHSQARLELAKCYQQTKQTQLAIEQLEQVLMQNANYIQAHQQLADIYIAVQNWQRAFVHLKAVIFIDPKSARSHYHLGQAYLLQKQYYLAMECFEKALVLDGNLGLAMQAKNQLENKSEYVDDAIKHIQSLIKQSPKQDFLYHNLANLYAKTDLKKAIECYQKSLMLNNKQAGTHYALANVFASDKQYQQAIKHYQLTLALEPDLALAYNNLGVMNSLQKNHSEAEKYYLKALELAPELAGAYANLGSLYFELKEYERAKEQLNKALPLKKLGAHDDNNTGVLLSRFNRFDEAEKYFKRVIQSNPDHLKAYNNLGYTYQNKRQYNNAKEQYLKALEVKPNDPTTIFNLSVLMLQKKLSSKAWELFEARKHAKGKVAPPAMPIPEYQGQVLQGKILVVFREQGFGDEIQFARYLPLLKKQKGVKTLIVVCSKPLKKIFAQMPCIDRVVSQKDFTKDSVKSADYWVLMMSLGLHFDATFENIPKTLPYLQVPPVESSNKISGKALYKVGLVWKGSATHNNDTNRSLASFAQLKPLWEIANAKDIDFISLQKGNGEEEVQEPPADQPILHLGGQINDFYLSAQIIKQLDLVICVDTAIAHLAGSLAVPCWVMLPYYGTDWRWQTEGETTPWYPNVMHLFRQDKDADWSRVIAQVAKKLAAFKNV